jgi:hypothetical protein
MLFLSDASSQSGGSLSFPSIELPNMVPVTQLSIISTTASASTPKERHWQIAAHKAHLTYQEMAQQLQGQSFLPTNDHKDSHFERLVYLSLLDSQGENVQVRLPFMKEQCEKFKTSTQLSQKTTRWLKWGAIPLVVFSLTGGATAFSILAGWSSLKAALVTGCTGAVSNVALSILGLLFTGTFPDDSSNAWNEKQNHFHDLKELYHNLALELIDLYFTQERRSDAEIIAKAMPSEIVRTRMKMALGDTGPRPQFGSEYVDVILFGPLQEAIDYILEKKYPQYNLFVKSFILAHEKNPIE